MVYTINANSEGPCWANVHKNNMTGHVWAQPILGTTKSPENIKIVFNYKLKLCGSFSYYFCSTKYFGLTKNEPIRRAFCSI